MRGWNLCVVYHREFQTVASRGLLQMHFMLFVCDVCTSFITKGEQFYWDYIPPLLYIFIIIYLELKQLFSRISPEYWQIVIVFLSLWCCLGPADLIINTFLKVRVKTLSCKSLQSNIEYTVNTNTDFCWTHLHAENVKYVFSCLASKKNLKEGK